MGASYICFCCNKSFFLVRQLFNINFGKNIEFMRFNYSYSSTKYSDNILKCICSVCSYVKENFKISVDILVTCWFTDCRCRIQETYNHFSFLIFHFTPKIFWFLVIA